MRNCCQEECSGCVYVSGCYSMHHGANGRAACGQRQNGHERLPKHLMLLTRHTKSISLPDTSTHINTHTKQDYLHSQCTIYVC